MAGIVKKIMPVSRSMSGKEYIDFDADISIALEYTGSPVNHITIPRAYPVDVDRIPTAKVAPSPSLLSNLSLPVVEPLVRSNFRASQEVRLGSRACNSNNQDAALEHNSRFEDSNANDHVSPGGGFEGNGNLKGFVGKRDNVIESSGYLGFSDSQDHSCELSESSDMVETTVDCQEIEGFQNDMNPEPSSTPQAFVAEIWCEDEEASDDEALECRRNRNPTVTSSDPDTAEVVGEEESMDGDERVMPERPVAERPAKRGMCYNCHRGHRFTEKETCIVCDAKYCKRCVLRMMGSMPEGRKCLSCIGFPVNESKRHMLGKCSRMLNRLLLESEVKRIMEAELSCPSNQLPAENVLVNGSPLCLEELMVLRSSLNPPRNLKPGNYWYDRVSGFWGKEGQKPYQIITPQLNVGDPIKRDASNGNTNVLINGREITEAELWMLKSAGVQCAGSPCFWVDSDGTYQEEGMNLVKGKIWGRKRTKLLCTLLSLPTPESPNPGGKSNHAVDGGFLEYFDQRALCNVLLVGNDHSGTSTVYKQVRVLYNIPFSEEERQDIKFMIQRNLYGYLGRMLEGREHFEEESLSGMRKEQSTDEPGPSATPSEIEDKSEYAIGPKLKAFSDWLIKIMVSGNLDIIFPASTREYAPYVEELWKDAAIQATYSRRGELELPRVACYFLDKATEIAKVDYEPSDTDVLYAEGLNFCNGLASLKFSFPSASNENDRDPAEQPDPVTRYQLLRAHTNSLGENCKWLEMFDDVRIVLFCVDLTEYDEYAVNSSGVLMNKMLESKSLFESIVTHPTFQESNFLLLLNKCDLLEEKIEHVPLTHCEWFQDFNPFLSHHHNSSRRRNGNNMAPLAQRAFHYMAVKFKRLFKSLTGRKLYVCPVTALKSDSVDTALRYAREIVRWEEDKLSYSLNDSSCESIEIEQSSYS